MEELFNIWVHKDDPTKCYSWGNDYEKLSAKKDLFFTCYPLNVVPDEVEEVPEDLSYSVYGGVVVDDALYHFRVALYDPMYMATYDSRKHQKIFSQKFFGPQDNKDPRIDFSPIIHLIPGLTWEDFNGNKPARFFRITDSSIWNYFVTNEEDFTRAVNNILSNWKDRYYELVIAHEFADLNARLTQQSYLYSNPDDDSAEQPDATQKSNGHAAAVSPFLFHSERNLATQRKEEYEKKLEGKVYDFKKYKWRVLLVDDRINGNYLKPYNLKVCKESIIENRIKSILWEGCYCKCVYDLEKYKSTPIFDDEGREPDMVILCVDSIEKAKDALKNYKFDFILLDYLLERYKDEDRKEIERHYGYELLTDLADEANGIGKDCADLTPYLHYDEGKRYIVGPDHRYFFMFISAFTTAISERLRLLGYSRSEELWHIAEGACPTNTPELFCYNLQKMMVKRIKDSGMDNLDPDEILKLTEKIFHKATDGKESVRKRANDNYSEILSLLYHYNRVRQDIEMPFDDRPNLWLTRGSVLMTAYFKDYLAMGGLLEHLAHLVHLTAFGTARQWSEMWEEYLYFKNQFTDLFNGRLDKSITLMIDDQKQTITIRAALNKLYNSIGDYILELKKIN